MFEEVSFESRQELTAGDGKKRLEGGAGGTGRVEEPK